VRAQQVAAQLVAWYNQHVGVSLLQYARLGQGRRIHILDTTPVEVPLATGTYECSGVVKNDAGTYARGYKLATLRTLLDSAGLLTQVALSAIQVHDMAACRPLLTQAPVLRAGDLLLEDRGFLDGAALSELKRTRKVDVIIPLKANMLASDSRRRRILLKINDLPHMTFVNIKSIESTTYAFYAASNATSFELTY